jgi:hypothetical protein
MTTAPDNIITSPTEATSRNLFAGLVLAQRAAHAVAKGSRNEFHKYNYASAEDVIQAAREALSVGDLALFPTAQEIVPVLPAESDDDAVIAVRVRYVLAHASGECREIGSETPIIPEKGRPWDKALAAAKTFDLAYTLRSVLLLPRGDQESVDSRDDRGWDKARRRGPAPQGGDRRPGTPPNPPPVRQERAEAPAAKPAIVAPPPPAPAAPPKSANHAPEVRAFLDAVQSIGGDLPSLGHLIVEVVGRAVQPRDMSELERASVLAAAKERGAPERPKGEALRVLEEARDAATEDAAVHRERQAGRLGRGGAR